MSSSPNFLDNLKTIGRAVEELEGAGADLVLVPELALGRGSRDEIRAAGVHVDNFAAWQPKTSFEKTLFKQSKTWKIPVLIGSLVEIWPGQKKAKNCLWALCRGERIARYEKIHLFDFQSEKSCFEESKDYLAGSEAVCFDWGGWKIGLSICYDLRFPELYRELTLKHQAELLLCPASFSYETGQAHWESLTRCRAIENQCFFVSAAQWGEFQSKRSTRTRTWGHSLAWGPWGESLFILPEKGTCTKLVTLDKNLLYRARKNLPALQKSKLLGSKEAVFSTSNSSDES